MKKYFLLISSFFLVFVLNACAYDAMQVSSQTQPSTTETETVKYPKIYLKPLAKFIPNETKGVIYYSYGKSSSTFFLYDPQSTTTTEFLKINEKIYDHRIKYHKNHLYIKIGPEDKDGYITAITDYSLQDQTYTTIPMQMTYQSFYITPTDKIIYPILDYGNYDRLDQAYPSTTIVVYDINEKTTKNLEINDEYVLEKINSEGFFINSYDDRPNEISILTGYWEIGVGSAILFDFNIDTGEVSNIKESSNDEMCLFDVTGSEDCTKEQLKEANDFTDFLAFPDEKSETCLDYTVELESYDTFLIKKDNMEKRMENAFYLGCVE